MKNEAVTRNVKVSDATMTGREAKAGPAPLETVGRSLGYTERELVLAVDVLKRFVWQRPAESPRKNAEPTEEGTIDSCSGRGCAA